MLKTLKKEIIIASFFLTSAVILGAFGAHGLKPHLTEALLETYKTGISYQFYHALGLLGVSLVGYTLKLNMKIPVRFFILGILLFSFNCYIYAITQVKLFALIVPVGGLSFISGWISFMILIQKAKHV